MTEDDKPQQNAGASDLPEAGRPDCARSMHDGVETWDDCCVCEPEPRWQALAGEIESQSREPHPGEGGPAGGVTPPHPPS